MARNVLGIQRGVKWSLEFRSFQRVKREMKSIGKLMSGDPGRLEFFQRIADELTSDIATLGVQLRDKIRSVGRANGIPNRVVNATFAFSDPGAARRKKWQRSALVGVRKGAPPRKDSRLYVEWSGGGKQLGESLATIFEKGTKHIRGKYYFLLGVKSMSAALLRRATEAYKSAVEKLNSSNGN